MLEKKLYLKKLYIKMKNKFLLLSISLFSTFLYAQTDYSFTYNNDSIINKGVKLHDEEKYNEAITEYNKIKTIDPLFLKAQYEKAMSLSALEKNDELRALLENLYSTKRMQETPDLYIAYGNFLSDNKEFETAEKVFTECEKYTPNSSILLFNKAILYIRKEEHQKAIDTLEKLITYNPNYASAHYFLGILAYENGKITEGSLALLAYLTVAPTGKYAEDSILKLNAKFGENYLDKNKYVFSKSGDNFQEIEEVLRSQLPLKKAYKVKSEIDDVIIRQVQAIAEYSVEHKMENGFFETTYIPFLKDIVQKKQFEGFSYYILLGMEEKIGKKLTSQKKTITNFYDNYLLKDFWANYGKRKLEHFGKEEEVIITYKNNIPAYVGPEVNGKKEGKFKLLDDDGDISGELLVKEDELDGLQKYYKKGKLTETKTFSKGKLSGLYTKYYDNGTIEFEGEYKEDKYDGMSKSYHVNGGKNCEVNFVDDERDGKMTCYFTNGKLKSETTYSKGKLNGTYTEYNEVGDIIEKYNYKDDLLDGKYVTYYDGKIIKTEADYVAGKIQTTYKKYYANGTLEQENKYENGKIKSVTYFEATGKKTSESQFNDKEEIESYIYYDDNEKKYFEEKYKSGELKSGLQYSNSNPKPIEVNLTKKAFAIKDLNNKEIVSGEFEKGKKNNEWKYYYSNGLLKEVYNYKQGKLDGLCTLYNPRGYVTKKLYYKDDKVIGVCENYENGRLKSVYNYENDVPNGPYKFLYPDGTISSEGYLVNNELNYIRKNYWSNGTISSIDKFTDDVLTEYESYTNKGQKENSVNYLNRTGKFTVTSNNGSTIVTSDLVNGERNGKYIAKESLGNTIAELSYLNGVKHGEYKYYSPMGTLQSTDNYYCGKQHGKSIDNDLVGNLRLIEETIFGEEYGKTTRFYHNKSKLFEYSKVNNRIENDYTYYNQKGEPVAIIGFQNNKAIYYISKNKTGELVDKSIIKDETATITSAYPNGKVAFKVNLVKGNFEGQLQINSLEGKPEFEVNYTKGLPNGDRIEYYSNGNIYKKERFANNNYDGTQEYYKEDGKKWLIVNYKDDEFHGNTEIYTNGKLTITKKYDSDELVEIIK